MSIAIKTAVNSLKNSLSVLGQGKTPIYLPHGGLGHYTYWQYDYTTLTATRPSSFANDTLLFETYYKPQLDALNVKVYPNLGCNDILGAINGNTLGVPAATGSTDYRTLVYAAEGWAYDRDACQINIENPWLTQLYYDLKQTKATIDSAAALYVGSQYNTLEPLLSTVEREWKRQALAGYAGITVSDTNPLLTAPTQAAVAAIVAAIKADDLNALKTWKQLIINLFRDCTRYCKGETIPHYAAPGGTLTISAPYTHVTHYVNLGFEFQNYQGIGTSELQATETTVPTPITGVDYFAHPTGYQSASSWGMDTLAEKMGAPQTYDGIDPLDWRSYHDRNNAGTVPSGYATNRYGTKYGVLPYMVESQEGCDSFCGTMYIFNEYASEIKDYVNDYMVRKDFALRDGDTGLFYSPEDRTIDQESAIYWWKRGYRDAYYNLIKGMHRNGVYLEPSHVHLSDIQTRDGGNYGTWYGYNHMWGWMPTPDEYADILVSQFIPYDGDRTQFVPKTLWLWASQEYGRIRLTFLTAAGSSLEYTIYGGRQWAERQLFGRPYIDTDNAEETIIGKLDGVVTSAVHQQFIKDTQFGDDYWSVSGALNPWWTPSGGNQGPLVGLTELDDPAHPLYPYLSGQYGNGTANVYGGNITAVHIKAAMAAYCSHWTIQLMTKVREKLKEINR